MKHFSLYCPLLLVCVTCFDAREIPSPGLLYSNHRFDGGFAASNEITSTRVGRGCIEMSLGLYATGNAGASLIADKAGIERIAYIDHEFFNVLGIYSRYCTIVYGD